MWYEQLLTSLLEKINNKERYRAEIFLKDFFNLLELSLLKDELGENPLELMLGIIDKMYHKFNIEKNQSVTLHDFSRYLVGLTIVYAKISFDKSVRISDFVKFKFFDAIGDVFSSEHEIQNYKALNNRQFKQLHDKDDQAKALILGELERLVLADLKFNMKVNLDNVLQILCLKVSGVAVIQSFYDKTASFKGKSVEFDDLRHKVSLFILLETFKAQKEGKPAEIFFQLKKLILDPNSHMGKENVIKLKKYIQQADDLQLIRYFYLKVASLPISNFKLSSLLQHIFYKYHTKEEQTLLLHLNTIEAIAKQKNITIPEAFYHLKRVILGIRNDFDSFETSRRSLQAPTSTH